MGNAKASKYSDGVDGRTVPKPSYVSNLARQEAQEARRRDWKSNFLRAYASNGNITKSCKAADIDPRLFYKARKEDESFAEAFSIAHRAATDKALEAIWEIGVEGQRKPIYYQNEIIGYERIRDWKAAKFILETFDPGTYSQRERIAQLGMKREDELNARRDAMLEAHTQRMRQFRGNPTPLPSSTAEPEDAEVIEDE